MSGIPYLTLKELAALFSYSDEDSARRALKRGTLPIPTYKLHGRIVADVEVVKAYFARKRAEGLAQLNQESSAS
jgi:hypothetical protein